MELKRKFSARTLVLTALFAALTAVFSQIIIPTAPVPFSLGIAAVFLCGGILSPFYSFTSLVVYLLLGMVGLPVYSKFGAGLGHLFGPTGGYLWAYPLMALFISLAVKYLKKYTLLVSAAAMILSLFLCYGIGSFWLGFTLKKTFTEALAIGAVPYFPFDFAKAVACAFLAVTIKKRIGMLKSN